MMTLGAPTLDPGQKIDESFGRYFLFLRKLKQYGLFEFSAYSNIEVHRVLSIQTGQGQGVKMCECIEISKLLERPLKEVLDYAIGVKHFEKSLENVRFLQ